MKMTYETKAGLVGGSITTVVPAAIANLLNIEKGSKIRWVADTEGNGVLVTIEPVTKQ